MQKIYTIVCLYCVFLIPNYGLSQTRDVLCKNLTPIFDNMTMIGILGDEYSRIDIRFVNVKKLNDTLYTIIGSSRTRMYNICEFKGRMHIDSVALVSTPKSEMTVIDGYVYGKYQFEEDRGQRNNGVFSGVFKQAFRIEQLNIDEPINLIAELKINLSEYIGVWKSYSGTRKICNWADAIIPNIDSDFYVFNDAGEWYVSPKYRKRGWDNQYNAYFNNNISPSEVEVARNNEEIEWWKQE